MPSAKDILKTHASLKHLNAFEKTIDKGLVTPTVSIKPSSSLKKKLALQKEFREKLKELHDFYEDMSKKAESAKAILNATVPAFENLRGQISRETFNESIEAEPSLVNRAIVTVPNDETKKLDVYVIPEEVMEKDGLEVRDNGSFVKVDSDDDACDNCGGHHDDEDEDSDDDENPVDELMNLLKMAKKSGAQVHVVNGNKKKKKGGMDDLIKKHFGS